MPFRVQAPCPGWKYGSLAAALVLLSVAPAMAQPRGSSSTVGYIDSAIPDNEIRFRFEAAYGINRSDRAEYLYSPGFDPNIDNQDLSTYVEMLLCPQLSGFLELHAHFVNPELAPNASGLGDTVTGFKYAFVDEDDFVASFQFKTYIPTGDGDRILGTSHPSLEPGLLVFAKLTDCLTFEGELRDWIPVGATAVGGNVLREGVGLSYRIVNRPCFTVTPVAELVAWEVLSGEESVATGVVTSAAGDFIANIKLGARIGFGACGDLYMGYGRALTGDVWYKDIVRVEYRLSF